jgi:hypothetical protein
MCSLQRSDSVPTLGKLLTSRPTKKAACEAAAGLKSNDVTDSDKCFDYTPNTAKLCKDEGVTLTK